MALVLPKSIFFHIPKTGGSWVKVALRRGGLAYKELGGTHCSPSCISHLIGDRKTFLFVRNPIYWYRSYFYYKVFNGWRKEDGSQPTDIHADWYSVTLEQFLDKVITLTPGRYSNMLDLYIDNPKINYVGKTESLTDDLVKILHHTGEHFDEKNLIETQMVNTCVLPVDNFKKEQVEEIIRLEKRTFERFGYSENVEDYVEEL